MHAPAQSSAQSQISKFHIKFCSRLSSFSRSFGYNLLYIQGRWATLSDLKLFQQLCHPSHLGSLLQNQLSTNKLTYYITMQFDNLTGKFDDVKLYTVVLRTPFSSFPTYRKSICTHVLFDQRYCCYIENMFEIHGFYFKFGENNLRDLNPVFSFHSHLLLALRHPAQ